MPYTYTYSIRVSAGLHSMELCNELFSGSTKYGLLN